MSDDSEPSTSERLAFLSAGTGVRVSDLSDALGGYSATVVEDTGRQLWIDIPIRRDGMLSLSVGQLISVRFDRTNDAVYLFDTVVSEVRDDDSAPYGLARPVTIDRRRHRADVRLALVLDATYQVGGDGEERTAKVADLSAGGLGLIAVSEHEVGDELSVRVALPGPEEPLYFESSVVIRTRTLFGRTPGGSVLNQYGLEFTDVSDKVRDKILGLVIWNLTQNPAVL